MGYRQILSEEDEKQPNGKIFQKYVMGGYTWLSYAEIEEAADDFGRALAVLVGKNNREKELSNNNIVIFSGYFLQSSKRLLRKQFQNRQKQPVFQLRNRNERSNFQVKWEWSKTSK